MSSCWQMAPISLANATFSAWKLLLAYLTIDASSGAHAVHRRLQVRVHAEQRVAGRASLSPMTVNGGFSKSAIALPSRRNSGLTQTPRPPPTARPLAFSSSGISRDVEHAGQQRAADGDHVILGAARERRADLLHDRLEIPRFEAAVAPARRADAQQRQLGRLHGGRRIARHRAAGPRATMRPSSASRPGSLMGDRPWRIIDSLCSSTSTPMTSWPDRRQTGGRHRADVSQAEDGDLHSDSYRHARAARTARPRAARR